MHETKSSAIDTLLEGSKIVGPSPCNVWDGLCVERRIVLPGERAEATIDHHYMLLWAGSPTIAEREYRPGRFRRVIKAPGTISLGSAGRLPAVRALTGYDVTVCTIAKNVADHYKDELDLHGVHRFHEHLGVSDPALVHLISLLALEAQNGGESGRLYCDSLKSAAISRFFSLASHPCEIMLPHAPLPKRSLRRVLDMLAANYHRDVTLFEMAGESGYSPAHFLRMFRAATGKTPCRYLRDLRLDEARRALIETDEQLASIAFRVGFSSHSHLTRLFRKQFGSPPSEFRRNK